MTNRVRAICSDMNIRVNSHFGCCVRLDNISVWPTFLWLSSWKNTDVFVRLEGSSYSLVSWKREQGTHTESTHTTSTPHHTRHTAPMHTFAYMQDLMHARGKKKQKNTHVLSHTHTFSHNILKYIYICGILYLLLWLNAFSFKHARPHNAGSSFYPMANVIEKTNEITFLFSEDG